MREVTPPVLLGMLRQIEDRRALETARRVRQRCSAVFVYAIAAGLAEQDPAGTLQKAMAPIARGRQPAITDLELAARCCARQKPLRRTRSPSWRSDSWRSPPFARASYMACRGLENSRTSTASLGLG